MTRRRILARAIETAGLLSCGALLLTGCDSGSGTGASHVPTAEQQADEVKRREATEKHMNDMKSSKKK